MGGRVNIVELHCKDLFTGGYFLQYKRRLFYYRSWLVQTGKIPNLKWSGLSEQFEGEAKFAFE